MNQGELQLRKLGRERNKYYQKYHKYPARTCTECILYPCFRGIENMKSDFAKYGCKNYTDLC